MSLTDAQFDRITRNRIKHNTPLSAGKLHRLLLYTINNYDELSFTRMIYLNGWTCWADFLKKEAANKLGNLYIRFDENKWTYKGTILELYAKLQTLRRNQHNIDRIIIDDERCRHRISKYNSEIYFVIKQCENIAFYDRLENNIDTISDLLPYMINKNITRMNPWCDGKLTFSNINYHKTHYQIGRTIYYKAYMLHRLFLVKQLTISDIMRHIGSYLIKLLDEL
jgi:hypothetical protein